MSSQLNQIVSASTESHLETAEALVVVVQGLYDEMESMSRWANSTFTAADILTIRSHLTSAKNYTDKIAIIREANILRADTMTTQQKRRLAQSMFTLADLEEDLRVPVDDFKFILEQRG